MADNLIANAGSGGATFATDEDTGNSRHFPGTKIMLGVDGTFTAYWAGDVTNTGTFVVQEDGASLTALQLIDDTVFVDDTATHTAATTKVLGIGAVATPTDTSLDANDIGMPAMSLDRRLHVDADITASVALDVSAATVTVDGSGVTQPVSAASLPLPTGASTSANQSTGNTSLGAIAGAVTGTEMQVDIVSGNVTNAGTFVVQEDGAALTSLQKLDNIAHSGSDVALVEHVPISGQLDDTATTTVTENQIAPVRITSTRALHVSQQGTAIVDGSGVTQPISAASLPLPSGASTSANQSTANTALSGIQTAVELIDNAISGTEMQVDVVAALPAGTNAIGKLAANSGVDIGDVDVLTLPDVNLAPQTAGGLTIKSYISDGVGEDAEVTKASAGQLYGWYVSNTNAAECYLKIYNKATAPAVASDTPVMRCCIPGNTAGVAGHVSFANGIEFTTGISFTIVTGPTDTDAVEVTANEVLINLFYK